MAKQYELGSTEYSLDTVKVLLASAVADIMRQKIDAALSQSLSYGTLWSEIARVAADGKRLRPYMVGLTALDYDPSLSIGRIMPAMLAVEFLHVAMLIQDDIIDRDNVRHNQPTIHAVYTGSHYSHLTAPDSKRHFSESAAMLAGDMLITEAYDQLLKCPDIAPDRLIAAVHELHQATFTVIGGELLDTESSFDSQVVSDVDTDAIAHQKTASYSFVAPLVIGAILADASETEQTKLRALGTALGVGFQYQDDLLGIFGDAAVLGKSTTGDIREGKITALVQHLYRSGSPAQIRVFEAAFRRPEAAREQLDGARQMLIDSGARGAVTKRVDQCYAEASALIDGLSVSVYTRARLYRLTDVTLRRER